MHDAIFYENDKKVFDQPKEATIIRPWWDDDEKLREINTLENANSSMKVERYLRESE